MKNITDSYLYLTSEIYGQVALLQKNGRQYFNSYFLRFSFPFLFSIKDLEKNVGTPIYNKLITLFDKFGQI